MGAVANAAKSGTHRELLEAIRDRVALAIDDDRTLARDLAALTRRQMDIAKELEALDAAEAEDDIGSAITTPDVEFDPASL